MMLAVLVTVGLTMSVAQATDMAMKMNMSMAPGMTTSEHGDCHDCDGGDLGKTKMMICAPVCSGPVVAPFPEFVPPLVLQISATIVAPDDMPPHGNASPPDPHPPQSIIDIG